MKTGPAPKPTAIKRLEGNPGKHALNEHEPQPTIGCPMPTWLPKGAQAYWKTYAPELEAMGVLAMTDGGQFAAYCLACWDLECATKALKPTKDNPHPQFQKAPTSGYETPSGWEMVRRRAVDDLRKLGAEFGMSAASRSRIQTLPKADKSDLEKLLGDDAN